MKRIIQKSWIWILLILFLMSKISVAAEEIRDKKGITSPKLTVFYHEYTRKNLSFSPDHMKKKVNSIDRREMTSDSELYIRENTNILLKIEGSEIEEDKIVFDIYEDNYEKSTRRKVTKEFIINQTWKRQGDCYYLSVLLNREGHFRIEVFYEDGRGILCGNDEEMNRCFKDGGYYGPCCTVDKSAPYVEKITDGPELLWKKHGIDFFTSPAIYEIIIVEENFHPTGFECIGRKDNVSVGSWVSYYEDGVRKNRGIIQVVPEGKYDIGWKIRDGSGRNSEKIVKNFLIDYSKPDMSIRHMDDEKIFRYFYQDITLFSDKPINFLITAQDNISGIAEIEYTFFDNKGEKRTFREENKEFGKTFQVRASLPEGCFSGRIEAKAKNGVGKEIMIQSMERFLWESRDYHTNSYDEKKTGIDIFLPKPFYTDSKSRVKYYNDIPFLRLSAWDDYSGVLSSYFKINYDKKDYLEEKDYSSEEKIKHKIEQISELLVKGYEKSNKDSPITICAGMKDNAGNVTTYPREHSLVVDTQAPKITIDYGEENIKKYYNRSKTVRVIVEDWNFNPDSVIWNITGKKKGYTIGEWKGKGKKHWCSLCFEKDGTYGIALRVSDYAGNHREWKEKKEIVIDKTSPEMVIWMKGCSDTGKNYYNSSKTLYVMIQDDHVTKGGIHLAFGSNRQKEKILNSVWKEKEKLPVPIKKYFKEKGWRIYTCTVSEEGKYRISGCCEDRAGNVSQIQRIPVFIIDKTPPEVTCQNIKEKGTFTNVVNPKIILEDKYLDSKKCKLQVYYSDGTRVLSIEKKMERFEEKEENSKVSFVWEDFPRRKEYDNYYIFKITVTDLAGNQSLTDNKISFYVDRYGARYMLEKETESYIEEHVHREEKSISVTAYSLHPLKTQIYLSYEGEEQRKLDKKNYEEQQIALLSDQVTEGESIIPKSYDGWYKTIYSIHKESFQKEGNYQILLQSFERDGEEHILTRSENTLWTRDIRFMIDKTPPTVIIGGLEEEYYLSSQEKYTVTAMDNTGLKRVRLYLKKDGSNQKRYIKDYGEKDFNENHSISEVLQAAPGYQILGYEAWDYAGNQICAEEIKAEKRILIMKNPIISLYYRYPFQVALAGIITIIVVSILIILTRKQFFDIVRKNANCERKTERRKNGFSDRPGN